MKSPFAPLAALLLAASLVGCGHPATLAAPKPLRAATAKAALPSAKAALPTPAAHHPSLHPLVGKFMYATAATFKADANQPGLGTCTFALQTMGGDKLTVSIVAFYNSAPRVLNKSLLVKLDGEQLLDETHMADAAAILATVHPYHSVDGKILDKAQDWLADKTFTRY